MVLLAAARAYRFWKRHIQSARILHLIDLQSRCKEYATISGLISDIESLWFQYTHESVALFKPVVHVLDFSPCIVGSKSTLINSTHTPTWSQSPLHLITFVWSSQARLLNRCSVCCFRQTLYAWKWDLGSALVQEQGWMLSSLPRPPYTHMETN